LNQNIEKLEIELRTQKSEELKQILEQQTQKVQIAVNIAVNSKRASILTELFVWCPKCGGKEIIMRKAGGNWKLGVCNRCNCRTWLKVLGKVKRFGNRKQYVKLAYLQTAFSAFWLNIGDEPKPIAIKRYLPKYIPLSGAN